MKVSCQKCGRDTKILYRLNKKGFLLYAICLSVILIAIAIGISFEGLSGVVVTVILAVPPLVYLRKKFDKHVSCSKCGAAYDVDPAP